MHITYKFISLNFHRPPNSLNPEAVTSCRRGWQPPCQCRPLSMRYWPWGWPGCYKAVYWPLSQLRSTWNNPQDYNLLSWEARFPGTVVLQPSASPGCFWLCLGWQGHKIHCPREAKSPFCVNFGHEWHLPPRYPGFGTKLSLKGKPGTCALLETFQSPIDLFSARKAF